MCLGFSDRRAVEGGVAKPSARDASDITIGRHRDCRTIRRIEFSNGQIPGTGIAENLIRARATELAPKYGLSVNDMPEWLEFDESTTNSSNPGRITVQFRKPDDAKMDPDQFLSALLDGIGKPIEKAYLDYQRDAIRDAKEHHENLVKKAAAATQRSAELRGEIGGLTQRVNNNDDSIRSAATKLEDELQAIDLDLMAKTERRKAMEEQIASQSGVIEKKMGEDPIVSELQKVVDARSSSVDLLKQQHAIGVATAKEVSDGIAALADARAKLLERKRQAAIEAGGDVIQGFTRELLTLSIDLREMKVRKTVIEERLDRLRIAAQMLDKVHAAETDAQTANTDLQNEGLPGPIMNGPVAQGRIRLNRAPCASRSNRDTKVITTFWIGETTSAFRKAGRRCAPAWADPSPLAGIPRILLRNMNPSCCVFLRGSGSLASLRTRNIRLPGIALEDFETTRA